MKKVILITFVVVLILSNIVGLGAAIEKISLNLLYSGSEIKIDYADDVKLFDENFNNVFQDELYSFCDNYNVDIAQYIYSDNKNLNIYSINVFNNPLISTQNMGVPTGSEYFSNDKVDLKDINCAEIFSFPPTSLKIRVYDFDQIRNVGLSNRFYLSSNNSFILEKFSETFSKYGEIEILDSEIPIRFFVNINLIVITLVSYILLVCITFIYLINNRNSLIIKKNWGYSNYQIIFQNSKPRIIFTNIIVLLLFLGLFCFSLFNNQKLFMFHYIIAFIVLNLCVNFLFVSILIICHLVILRFLDNPNTIRGGLPYKQILYSVFLLKVIVGIILYILFSSSLNNYKLLSQKLDAINYWDETKNIYLVSVGNIDEKYINDLEHNRNLNDRLYRFYKEMEIKRHAFLIKSDSFIRVNPVGEDIEYSYLLNLNEKNKFYGPFGKRIDINLNYLDVNPIESVGNLSIPEQFDYDTNTINLLVPIKFKKYDKEIIKSYRDYFYFAKVEVDNMYNEKIGLKMNDTSLDELSVNIIYVKDNQSYFTFNTNTGDEKNQIIDPIVIVYNGSFDTSFVSSGVTNSLYFSDTSGGRAYESIAKILEETNVPEISFVESIYGRANSEIINLENKLFIQLFSIFASIVALVTFVYIMIWSYHKMNAQKIVLKMSFGYSICNISKNIIKATLISNLLAASISLFIFKESSTFAFMLIIILVELIQIILTLKYIASRNISSVLKGDFI